MPGGTAAISCKCLEGGGQDESLNELGTIGTKHRETGVWGQAGQQGRAPRVGERLVQSRIASGWFGSQYKGWYGEEACAGSGRVAGRARRRGGVLGIKGAHERLDKGAVRAQTDVYGQPGLAGG